MSIDNAKSRTHTYVYACTHTRFKSDHLPLCREELGSNLILHFNFLFEKVHDNLFLNYRFYKKRLSIL